MGEDAGELAGVHAGGEREADGEHELAGEKATETVAETGRGVDLTIDIDAIGKVWRADECVSLSTKV